MILSSHGNLSTPYVCTNRAACCQKMSEVHLCHLVLLLLVPAWQLFLSTTPASRQACANVCDRTFQTFSFACVCWDKSQVEGLDNWGPTTFWQALRISMKLGQGLQQHDASLLGSDSHQHLPISPDTCEEACTCSIHVPNILGTGPRPISSGVWRSALLVLGTWKNTTQFKEKML